MIKGTGVDIIEISRIEKSLTNKRFIERIFTKKEQEYCNSRKQMTVSSYAARFAAKEAVVKALGTGISGGGLWTDIEILPDDDGAPHVKLYGYFAYIATKRKIYNIFISLSHCKEYAVAQAILEG